MRLSPIMQQQTCLQCSLVQAHALLALPARSGDAEMSTCFRPGGAKRVSSVLLLALFVSCLLPRSIEAVNGEYSKEAIIRIAVLKVEFVYYSQDLHCPLYLRARSEGISYMSPYRRRARKGVSLKVAQNNVRSAGAYDPLKFGRNIYF